MSNLQGVGPYNLFLDDYRKREQVYPANQGELEWLTVKSTPAFIQAIEQHGLPKFVAFDHDLSEEHYKNHFDGEAQTGLDAARWLCEYCHKHQQPLPRWSCHSMSIDGKRRIISLLSQFERDGSIADIRNP